MSSEVSIRVFERSDSPEVVSIFIQLHEQHVVSNPNVFKPMTQMQAEEFLLERASAGLCRVLILNGLCAGYSIARVKIHKESPITYQQKVLFLEQLAVADQHRCKGLGKRLIEDLVVTGKEHEAAYIELDVWDSNQIASQFFLSEGFRKQNTFMRKPIPVTEPAGD